MPRFLRTNASAMFCEQQERCEERERGKWEVGEEKSADKTNGVRTRRQMNVVIFDDADAVLYCSSPSTECERWRERERER